LQIVCAKVREGDNRIVRIKEGDPAGRHVVIVDDLVQSGGTLIECQVCKSMHMIHVFYHQQLGNFDITVILFG
jgi:adenine/guanine phosphoribosyltransferase-like PRPP-binding protein